MEYSSTNIIKQIQDPNPEIFATNLFTYHLIIESQIIKYLSKV